MSRRLLKTLIILAVTSHVRTQYIDFFQSFSSFIQPYQTTRRSEVVTKRTTAKPKPRYQDAIFFETDDFIKQRQNGGTVDPYTTTMKPKRKNKVTIKPSTKSPWYFDNERNNANSATNNYNNYNTNSQTTKKNTNDNGNIRVDNDNNRRDNENNRRVDKDNNVYYDVTNNPAKNYRQTEKPIVYNHHFNVAQKPTNSRPIYNRRTTVNPLLNRPGVRPAVVDDNRPPITNRPVTSYTERPTRAPINEASEPEIDIGPDEDEMSEVERRRYIEIAEQKCDEYKSMNTKKVVALPLATLHASQGVELNISTCTPINIPLIIGGKVVSIQEFPHMSLVGWKNIQKGGYSWKCGGTLISEQFILTAGHCTYHDKDYNVISGPPQAVQLGSSYIDGQDSLVVSISSLIRHPKYKLRRSYFDVALIKLVTTVRFSESISPACLGVPPAVGNRIIATGWGRTEFGGDSSPELRSVSVPIWDMGDCREVWGTSRKLPEGPSPSSQICAGERGGGKDTCQGDSGGPAQIQDGCTWRVVAVTSIGRSCGAAETPALYAKLPRAFIASQVFSNVKLSNNRNNNNNGNNNRDNGNNSDNRNNNGDRNNNTYNTYWGSSNGASNGNNNWGVTDNRFNNQGSTDLNVANRPGNHQTIGNNWSTSNQFGNPQSSTDVNRLGNHQVISNQNSNSGIVNNNNKREEAVYRPGNHQAIDYNNRDNTGTNYFITSQTSGNRDGVITRPGNHQTIDYDNNNRGDNYFVTSHTSNNNRETASRPGNHQIINNDNNRGITANNYFVTSNTNGNNRDTIRLGNHQTVESNRGTTLGTNYFVTSYSTNNRDSDIRPGNHQTINNNNRFSDSQNSESSQDAVFNRPDRPSYNQNANVNNNARPVINNEHNSYYNNQQNSRTTYSNFGTQNSDYGTTESVLYNRNNNAYNENNNREYLVANRPWWSR